MGQAMTSETLSIHGEDGYRYWVGLQAKPFHRGCRKTSYKGVLLGQGARQWEKVAVKSFTSLPNTRENWQMEKEKAKLAKDMAVKFKEEFTSGPELNVVLPVLVQMDKVSKVNQWLERRHGFTVLNKDDWVSVEEHLPDTMYRYCPWSEWPAWNDVEVTESEHLSTFSHFTYLVSDGKLVVCDLLAEYDDKGSYTMTDVTVHSRENLYGHFDYGDPGIIGFFHCHRCTEVCKDWPKFCEAPLQTLDFEDSKKRVHFDMKLDKVIFTRGSLKQRLPTLRRHASDEGAKLRKKWLDRFNRSSQLHPLAVKEGPPPYEDLPRFEDTVVPQRLKSWTIADISYSGSPRVTRRTTDTAIPTKSCLKRTVSDQQVSGPNTSM